MANVEIPYLLEELEKRHDAEIRSLTHLKLVEKKERIWKWFAGLGAVITVVEIVRLSWYLISLLGNSLS